MYTYRVERFPGLGRYVMQYKADGSLVGYLCALSAWPVFERRGMKLS